MIDFFMCILLLAATGLIIFVSDIESYSITAPAQRDSSEWLYCKAKKCDSSAVILSHGKQSHYSRRCFIP